MSRFALIELNSGFIWHVCDAESPEAACCSADREADYTRQHGEYQEISRSDLRTSAGGYAVHQAPACYVCDDDQDADEIAEVGAMPLVGYYRSLTV